MGRGGAAGGALAWITRPRIEIRELTEVGDQVLASVTVTGRGRQSGVEASRDIWHLWTVQDSKVVRGQGFKSRDQALDAAGVLE